MKKGFFSIELDDKRVFGLDFLRALAIIFVMYGHVGIMLNNTRLDWFACLPIPHGVDIFFIMSGLLIGKSLISYLDKHENHLDRHKILKFYDRTALRILPNYYFMMFVNYILVSYQIIGGGFNEVPIWRYVTFTHNLFTPFWHFYLESWSLSVQWWFYIFFPLLLVLLCRFSKPKRFIPWLCLFFIIFSMIYRSCVANEADSRFMWDIWIRKTAASRIDNIYFGVLAVWVMHYFPKQWERYALPSLVIGLVVYAVTCIIPKEIGSMYYNVVYLTLTSLAIALWLPFFTKIKSYKTAIGGFISRISILSYAMFLANLCVLLVMLNNFSDFVHSHYVIAYLIYWPIVVAVSYVLHIFIEKPFMKLRDRL